MTTSAEPSSLSDWAPLVERLRLARVTGATIDVDSVSLGVPARGDRDALLVDPDNGLADVDARLPLSVIGDLLAERGWTLPLIRPLSSTPLWRLALRAPFVVDALCQRATLLTVDGDVVDTPPAPRHAAGPSLLHGVTTAPPLALLVRAHLRILSLAHVELWGERHEDTATAARRVRALLDEGRAFAVDAFGRDLWVCGGAAHAATHPWRTSTTTPWTSMASRWASARSLPPGDLGAISAALDAGRRVAAVPFMQRAAVLERARTARALVDVRGAVAHLAGALRRADATHRTPGSAA